MSPPCPHPEDTRASLEQQAGKALTGKGRKISTWDILMLFTHFLPSVSLRGAWGQTMVPVKWVAPSLRVGKGHLQVLSTDRAQTVLSTATAPCSPHQPPQCGMGTSRVLGTASLPYSHRRDVGFDLLGSRGHPLVAKLQPWSEMEGATCVLCFHQIGWIPQHWGSSLVPVPLTGTHEGSQSGFPFSSSRVFGQPGEGRPEPTHPG